MKKQILTYVIMISLLVTDFWLIKPEVDTPQTTSDLSERYLNFYHTGKISELERYWASDIEFRDETARITGESMIVHGKENLKGQLETLFASVEELNFTQQFGFTSGDFTISAGAISYQMPVSENTKTKVTFDVVTIIEVKEGKVVKHSDYADYESLIKQLNK